MQDSYNWQNAQIGEIEWWRKHQALDFPTVGEGGLKRYPSYLQTFANYFSKESILDVGAGPFPLVTWLVAARRASLDPLNDQYLASGFPRNAKVQYYTGLAEQLPFPDNEFDQVLLLNMLDHLANWRSALDEAVRVARSSVIIHVHIDAPFATDGLHNLISEEDFIAFLEHRFTSERVPFYFPKDTRGIFRRLASGIRKAIMTTGSGFTIPHEKCWAGVIHVSSK